VTDEVDPVDDAPVAPQLEDDPRRPYKVIAAVVASVAVYLLGQQVMELEPWVIVLLNVILVGLSTFLVRNPKV